LLLLLLLPSASASTGAVELLPAREGGEEVLKVEIRPESALAATKAGERVASRAAKGPTTRVTTGAARVEAGRTELVVCLLLLRVREDLVGRLDLAELVLGRRVLVGVGVEFLGEPVVGLFDFRCRRRLVDAEGFIRVFLG
jgi:hypothetical protein